MMVPLWVLALLSLGVGVYSTLTGHFLSFGPAEGEHGPVVVDARRRRRGGRRHRPGVAHLSAPGDRRRTGSPRCSGPSATRRSRKFWIDDIYEGVLGMALFTFSRIIGWLDRYLVDGVLNVVSAWTVSAGGVLRTVQTGRAQDYVYGVAVGLLILILWMRWALA